MTGRCIYADLSGSMIRMSSLYSWIPATTPAWS